MLEPTLLDSRSQEALRGGGSLCLLRSQFPVCLEVEHAGGGGLLQFVGAVGIDCEQQTSRWPLPQYHGYRILQLS